ncbi:MAG: hypothetical protein ACLQU3_30320 [Limisphaerales bacterium]
MSAKVVRLGVDVSCAPLKPVLDVLLLYEDFGTALRAKHSLDLLPVSFITEGGMRTNLWRLDLLGEPLLRDQAAREAAAADLIILSLHGHDRLQAHAHEWLNRWLDYKENRPYALAVLLDPGTANAGPDHPVVAHVKRIAAAASADLFYSFCQTPIPAAQWGPAGITPSPRTA